MYRYAPLRGTVFDGVRTYCYDVYVRLYVYVCVLVLVSQFVIENEHTMQWESKCVLRGYKAASRQEERMQGHTHSLLPSDRLLGPRPDRHYKSASK